jgi:hypothetical protein
MCGLKVCDVQAQKESECESYKETEAVETCITETEEADD